jgi:hypothetical protein
MISFGPVHDRTKNRAGEWYRQKCNSRLHRYALLSNVYIALVPVHIFTGFAMVNHKAPSKTVVHTIWGFAVKHLGNHRMLRRRWQRSRCRLGGCVVYDSGHKAQGSGLSAQS